MPGLTIAPPPTPVAATRHAEVRVSAQGFADGLREYLHLLFDRLILPHTEWSRGTGRSATSASVSATVGPSPQSAALADTTFKTLGLPQTTAAVQGKSVLLAIALLKRDPTPTWALYFDGVLIKTVASTVPLPPPIAEPTPPGVTIPLPELEPETFRDLVQPQADYQAALLVWLVDAVWRERWAHVTRWWWGVVEAVQVTAKTATVRLDAFPGTSSAATQSCGFGTRAWTAAQLQGRRVRVGWDRTAGWWVDDWA